MYSNKVKKGKHCTTYTPQLVAQSAPCQNPQLATFGRANARFPNWGLTAPIVIFW